jgi:hypothetical protein
MLSGAMAVVYTWCCVLHVLRIETELIFKGILYQWHGRKKG